MEYHAGSNPTADAHGEFQRRNIGSQVPTRVMSSPSSSQCGFDNIGPQLHFGHMFAAMALPEVETFSDPHGKGFSEFVMRFSMKYGNLGLRDNMLVHLLFSKLDGYPKAAAEALPKHIREGSFEDIIEALSSKFKQNESATQMKAYMQLKNLRMTKDVTRYCLELESLTRRAYPDASEEELSRTRAGELVSQLTEWPEYLQLFTTMELAPKESAYEVVKAMAQRCERSKEIAASMREASGEEVRHPHLEGRETQVVGRREEDSQPLETSSLSGTSCRPRVQQQSSFKNKIKCYNCNKLGHLRRDCRDRKVADKTAEKKEHGQGSTGTAKMFTASLSEWICGSAGKVKGHDELVGRQTVTNVRLLGLTRKALLDTGSQISIIPLGMFQASLASGFDLDADVEEIPINQRNPVYHASGNKMSFKGAVRLTLQLGNDGKRRIALFVVAEGDGMVVLGTNALAKLGIGPTSTSGVLMTADEKAVNEAAGTTSTTVKPTQRRRRRKQQSDVAEAPNSSSLAGAKLLRVGEGVGKHERPQTAVKLSQGRRRRKQREKAAPASATVLPKNRMSAPTRGTACSKCKKFPEMMVVERNGSGEPPVAKSSAGAKLLRAGEVDKGCEPILPRKSRANRGSPRRARQKERTQSGKILRSRTLLATGEQLGSRCARDISGPMDEMNILSLRYPLVRSDQMAGSRPFCRHLAGCERECCGALAFFRSPFEDRSECEWRAEGDPCKDRGQNARKLPPEEPKQGFREKTSTRRRPRKSPAKRDRRLYTTPGKHTTAQWSTTHWQGPRRRKQLHEATTAPKSN